MRTIPPALAAGQGAALLSRATCWKITRRDGVVVGCTDHDLPLSFEGVTYDAATGFTPSAVVSDDGLAVDNLEVEGMLDGDHFRSEELLAGLYDHAAIEIFQVDPQAPANGRIVLRAGWLGEVGVAGGRFTAEVRGLTQPLAQGIGALYTPACRARFGDDRCKVDLASRTVQGTLTSVTSREVVADSARLEAAGVFGFGTLTFLDGANQGISVEIREFSSGTFRLVLPLPYAPAPGDAYRAVAGCDKTLATCIARFGNAINFRGEPHVPGTDRLLETAGTRSVW